MTRNYYLTLVAMLLLCVLVSIFYYYLRIQELNSEYKAIKTQYEYVYVDHPIQPVPKIKAIDIKQVLLGKALFHSTLLSKDNSVSCASCHQINLGGDDGFSLSTGVNNHLGDRNSPTVLNSVFNLSQFWDGRANSLNEQIEGPIHNPVEMSTNWKEVIKKLEADSYFKQAFSEIGAIPIEVSHIKSALVIYEESLITPDAPIDQYLKGNKDALSNIQKAGLTKFISYGCITCHQGVNIGANLYQKIGRIKALENDLSADLGRFNVTNKESDRHVFKVPSLRNIAQTAPYFHDGSVQTLEEAVTIMARFQLGRELTEQDVEELVALLQSFSAPPLEVSKL